MTEPSNDYKKFETRARLMRVLGWHVNHEQYEFSDDALVMHAINEYLKHKGRALIDPNE